MQTFDSTVDESITDILNQNKENQDYQENQHIVNGSTEHYSVVAIHQYGQTEQHLPTEKIGQTVILRILTFKKTFRLFKYQIIRVMRKKQTRIRKKRRKC